MMDKYLLFICLLSMAIPLSWAEAMKRHASENDNSVSSQGKHRRLFARRRTSSHLEPQTPLQKVKSDKVAPARRCSRLMENCSPHMPCCDPCGSCRCRLFNTICHCWKMGLQCSKKT